MCGTARRRTAVVTVRADIVMTIGLQAASACICTSAATMLSRGDPLDTGFPGTT